MVEAPFSEKSSKRWFCPSSDGNFIQRHVFRCKSGLWELPMPNQQFGFKIHKKWAKKSRFCSARESPQTMSCKNLLFVILAVAYYELPPVMCKQRKLVMCYTCGCIIGFLKRSGWQNRAKSTARIINCGTRPSPVSYPIKKCAGEPEK